MDLRGYNREQAEDEIYRRVKQEVSGMETRTDSARLLCEVQNAVSNYYKRQLQAEHKAMLANQAWYQWENAYKRELAGLLANRYDMGLHETKTKYGL